MAQLHTWQMNKKKILYLLLSPGQLYSVFKHTSSVLIIETNTDTLKALYTTRLRAEIWGMSSGFHFFSFTYSISYFLCGTKKENNLVQYLVAHKLIRIFTVQLRVYVTKRWAKQQKNAGTVLWQAVSNIFQVETHWISLNVFTNNSSLWSSWVRSRVKAKIYAKPTAHLQNVWPHQRTHFHSLLSHSVLCTVQQYCNVLSK
jgi:hypothetical protein